MNASFVFRALCLFASGYVSLEAKWFTKRFEKMLDRNILSKKAGGERKR
jgi:hypothetical protein